MHVNGRVKTVIGGSFLILTSILLGQQPQPGARGAAHPQDSAAARPANRFGLASPLPRASGAIRLATYNLLNLFDDKDDPALAGEHDDAGLTTSPQRCAKLAEAIRAIDADVIALQEVESLGALSWFRDRYLNNMGYKHLASLDVGYYRGVECSVMSRFKISSSRVWQNERLDQVKRSGSGWSEPPLEDAGAEPLTFQRSPLRVDIESPNGYALTVFSLHHKAGREFDYHREAEALRIVEFIEELRRAQPSRNIVVMGDFNASPFDKSYRVYLEAGMIDSMAHRLWQGDDAEARLFKTHESNRVLDYILLNSAAHRELVIGSPFVLGTLTPSREYDFRTDPFPDGYASDHYPVVLDLIPKDKL